MVKNDYKDRSDRRRGRGDYKRAELLTGKALPAAKAAEARLLAAAMLDAEVVHRAYKAGVREVSFSESKAGLLWSVIERLWKAQRSTDAAVVVEEMKRTQQLEVLGDGDARAGLGYVLKVSQEVPTTAQAAEYIERVVETAELRDLIAAGAALQERCYDYAGGGLAEAVAQEVDAIANLRVKAQKDLPAIMTGEEFAAEEMPEPPQLIEGLMHMGRRTLIAAPSKAHKTWVAIDISISIAYGVPIWGMKTHKARVLHVDLELPKWGLKGRAKAICDARGLKLPDNVDWWSLDGYQRDIDELMPSLLARAPLGKYGLIVIEPAYVLLGRRDENDNGDVTDFMNRLSWIARLTGAAVLCAHHFAKGDAGSKDVKDRASGAGAWVRAPDTLIALTQLETAEGEAEAFRVDFVLRNLRRHAAIGVEWTHPVMREKNSLDLNALREPGRPEKKENRKENVVALLPELPDGLSYSMWQRKAEARGMPKRTFDNKREEALTLGLVKQVGTLWVRAE